MWWTCTNDIIYYQKSNNWEINNVTNVCTNYLAPLDALWIDWSFIPMLKWKLPIDGYGDGLKVPWSTISLGKKLNIVQEPDGLCDLVITWILGSSLWGILKLVAGVLIEVLGERCQCKNGFIRDSVRTYVEATVLWCSSSALPAFL